MLPLLLIHGGLWEPMDAERFWVRPGVVAGLTDRGYTVTAPDRLPSAPSWAAEVEHLLPLLPHEKVVVVAGSNGCSVGARLAADHPERIAGLILAWPAAAGDTEMDAAAHNHLRRQGATHNVVDDLLAGGTLRGVTDEQLANLPGRVAVLGSRPENRIHQRRTVDALLRIVNGSVELTSCPEPPRPEFAPYRPALVEALAGFVETIRAR
jgi:pimeloyl-ACP methyl ester carboxylesterase